MNSGTAAKTEYSIKLLDQDGNEIPRSEYKILVEGEAEFTESNVTVRGTKNILMQPEFNDTNKIRDLLNKFEDKDMINSIKEEDNGIKIYIGSENEFSSDVTVIKTKYSYNGEEGTIALIGPKRMEYDRVLTLLNYIKEHTDR